MKNIVEEDGRKRRSNNENNPELIEALGATTETWMSELSTIFSKDVFDEADEAFGDDSFNLKMLPETDDTPNPPTSPKISRSKKHRTRKQLKKRIENTTNDDLPKSSTQDESAKNLDHNDDRMLEEIARKMENENKEIKLNETKKLLENFPKNSNENFCGFQTASFKDIKISDSAQKKALSLFAEIDKNINEEKTTTNENSTGEKITPNVLTLTPKIDQLSPRPLVDKTICQNLYKTPTSTGKASNISATSSPLPHANKRRSCLFKPPRSVKKKH